MTCLVLVSWYRNVSAKDHRHHESSTSVGNRTRNISSRSDKVGSCDCNSQGPWLPIFKPSTSIKSQPLSYASHYLGVGAPKHRLRIPDNFKHVGAHGIPEHFNHIGWTDHHNANHIGTGVRDNYNHIGAGTPDSFNHIGSGTPENYNHIGADPPVNYNHIGTGTPENYNNIGAGTPENYNHIGTGAPENYNNIGTGTPDNFNHIGTGTPENYNHIGADPPINYNHIRAGTPDSFNQDGPAGELPGNRHMIHVHLIPHLYVPIVNRPVGSEDHQIQQPQAPLPSAPSSAETPSLPEKHINENHIVENHFDEFGNPYDPNQSEEVDEDDEGEITNVDIHTYSSDDQGGSSHTHYTKNNGVSYESFEQTASSGTGDHGAQSSSYENSNSYYTIPPDVNMHHYNMHSEYNNLLSKVPNLNDLGDYKPQPILLNQYEVHENTVEDTSNNNLAPTTEKSQPISLLEANQLKPLEDTSLKPLIETNHLNLLPSNNPLNNKYQFGKVGVKQQSDIKHGKQISLPLPSSGQHDAGVKMIISPNIQLQHNQVSPAHYSFSRAPSYFLDQSHLKPKEQEFKPYLNSYSGHFPIKSLPVNLEKLPPIPLEGEKIIINSNPKLINRHNPFHHRVKLNPFIPLHPIKSRQPFLNSLHDSSSYFKSKDFLKPLYSFQNHPGLQPLFKAEPSNSNTVYLPHSTRNVNMMKLKPQILADYSTGDRQNHVRHIIMNRQYDVSQMRPPTPAQKQTWSETVPMASYQQIIPDSYAKITLPKSIYHLNLLRTPVLS